MKYVVMLCLALAGCVDDTHKSVLIVGDSNSLGFTPYVQVDLSLTYDVYHSEGAAPKNNDRSTSYTLAHIKKWLADAGPVDVIHANWGLWDILDESSKERTPLPQYKENLEQLAGIFEATHSRIIWATTTDVRDNPDRTNADIDRYNAALVEVAKEHHFEIDDLHAKMLPYQSLHNSVLHYSDAGYQVLSDFVSQSIESE